MFMVQDNSPEFAKTWEFLKMQINYAVPLHDILIPSDTGRGPSDIGTAMMTVFSTARNILGVDFERK